MIFYLFLLHFFNSFDFSLDVSFSFLNSAFFHGFLNSRIWYAMAISFNFCQFEWVWSERALMLSLVLKSTPGVWCRSIQFFWWCHSLLHQQPISTRPFFSLQPLFWGAEMSRPTPDIMAPLNTTIQNHSEPFWIFKTINYTKITQN